MLSGKERGCDNRYYHDNRNYNYIQISILKNRKNRKHRVMAMTTIGALPMYVAVPISLIGTSFSSIGAFIGYLMTGYLPDMWLMIAIIIGGFVGGMLGSRAQKLFSEKTLKIVLAFTLFFLFFRFFKIEIWI